VKQSRLLVEFRHRGTEGVTPRGSAEIVFPTVARGPPASQSSYLPDEKYTLYRRAHICHQITNSGTVDLGPLFSNEEVDLRDHRRVRWRDPSIGGVLSPKDKESKSVTDQSHSTTVTAQSYLNSLIIEFTPHT
jgi:hypothetical protein